MSACEVPHTTQKAYSDSMKTIQGLPTCRQLLQARAILARRLLQRCFKEWARRCADRRWKMQLAQKEQQLQLLAHEVG